MGMCRFHGFDDVEYRKVVAALERVQKRIVEGAVNSVSPGSSAAFIALIYVINCARNELATQRWSPAILHEISGV